MSNKGVGLRTCRCSSCERGEDNLANGNVEVLAVYGDACGNCGFYRATDPGRVQGVCRRFAIEVEEERTSLWRRRLGKLEHGFLPLWVGAAFSCGDFHPVHNAPQRDSPALPFWYDQD